MTALQLRAELDEALKAISDDEVLMTKALKYIKRLIAQKESPTLKPSDSL